MQQLAQARGCQCWTIVLVSAKGCATFPSVVVYVPGLASVSALCGARAVSVRHSNARPGGLPLKLGGVGDADPARRQLDDLRPLALLAKAACR